jgi:hypothetical protein
LAKTAAFTRAAEVFKSEDCAPVIGSSPGPGGRPREVQAADGRTEVTKRTAPSLGGYRSFFNKRKTEYFASTWLLYISVAGLVIDEQTGGGNPAKQPPHRSLFRVRT